MIVIHDDENDDEDDDEGKVIEGKGEKEKVRLMKWNQEKSMGGEGPPKQLRLSKPMLHVSGPAAPEELTFLRR